jgi:Germination protease.
MKREFENLYIENAALFAGTETFKRERVKISGLEAEKGETDGGGFYSIELPESLFMNDDLKKRVADALSDCLKKFFKKHGIKRGAATLAVGVGNEGMTADALGARTLKYLEVTEHLYRDGLLPEGKGRLAAIAGSVSGVTGLLSYDIIKAVSDRVKPDIVIAVDTLASKRASRLQRVIQISDRGITPGSGVDNSKTALNNDSLGVPVIAVGVPLVIYARNIVSDYMGDVKLSDLTEKSRSPIKRAAEELEDLVVTVKEIDVTVDDFAKVIGTAINGAVHGN